MTKYHEKMFRIMNQFRKLNISDMLPGISRMEYLTMLLAMKAEDDRRISVSELIKRYRGRCGDWSRKDMWNVL